MELEKKYLHMGFDKGKASSQITIDDDYNVPDYKADVVKIIHNRGEVHFDEIKVEPDHVLLKGRLDFAVLYRSDQKDRRIANLSGSVGFQETLVMEGVEEFDPLQISAEIEDLSVGIINSRKLGIRALLMIKAVSRGIRDEEIVNGIRDGADTEVKKNTYEVLELVLSRKDTLRIRQELPIPANKPNIQEILWKSIQPRNMESRLKDEELEITGEVLVGIIYTEEGEEEHFQWLEERIPVKGSVECRNCRDGMIPYMIPTVSVAEVESRPDYDNEERMLLFDMVLDLDIRVWQEAGTESVEDVYSLAKDLKVSARETNTEKLLLKNDVKTKIREKIVSEHAPGEILQICTAEAKAWIENMEIQTGSVQAEGLVSLEVPYMTREDNMPIGLMKGLIPFSQIIEIPGITSDSRIEIHAGIDELEADLAEESRLDITAVVSLDLAAFAPERFPNISEVQEAEKDLEKLSKLPGITGYIVREGDSLWDIAKENETTVSDIMNTNQLPGENLQTGDKLLIIKKVSWNMHG